MELTVKKISGVKGVLTVPGDKSISHRAVMLGALAQGKTEIHNFLTGEDCLATIKCFQSMGIEINNEHGVITVYGKGLKGLVEPEDVLNCGNSGTTARLMLGILAGQPFFSVLTGDSSLRRRPMERVVKPLMQMGASFMGRKNSSLLPLSVTGAKLKPIHYHSPVASAQVKSAILFAGLFANGTTVVEEPALSRDHTERMLKNFGARVEVVNHTVAIEGCPVLTGRRVFVPGDISSAAFFLVAAAIMPDSDLTIKDVGLNPTRNGIIDVLKEMGANITVSRQRTEGGEPVGDIRVQGGELTGTVIGGEIIPRLIDELPVLAVAAAVARGRTVIKDAAELRVKETDRIAATAAELAKFGVKIEEKPDGMIIEGGRKLTGAVCHSYGDHRIAMAMTIAGLVAEGQTTVHGAEIMDISFPGFVDALKSIVVE